MNAKAKRETIMVAGLVAILAVLLPGALKQLGHDRPRQDAKAASGARITPVLPELAQNYKQLMEDTFRREVNAPQQEAIETRQIEPIVEYTAAALRDPMISLLPKAAKVAPASSTVAWQRQETKEIPAPVQPPDVMVQGLIWGGSHPQVLIDGRLYDLGDSVQGARIVEIVRDGVRIEREGATFLLRPRASATMFGDSRARKRTQRTRTQELFGDPFSTR